MLRVDNNSNFKIKWYFNNNELSANADNLQISTVEPGSYRAEFMNNGGCTRMSATFSLSFSQLPVVAVSQSRQTQLCSGETITLRATSSISNSNFVWSTGATTTSITVGQAGKYWVRATTPSGCSAVSGNVDVIVNPSISIKQPDDYKICVLGDEKLLLEAERGFVAYTWNGVRGSRNS